MLSSTVYRCFCQTYEEALKGVLSDHSRWQVEGKVKIFISSWIDKSLWKVSAFFSSRDVNPITREKATSIYCSLIAPYGCDSSCSGIPSELLASGPTHYADDVASKVNEEFDRVNKKRRRSGVRAVEVFCKLVF